MTDYSIKQITKIKPEYVKPLQKLIKKQYQPIGGPFIPLSQSRLLEIIKQDRVWLYGLFYKDQLVGTVFFYLKKITGRDLLAVEDLRIEDKHQGQGLGQEMVELIIKKAEELKVSAIELATAPDNDVARHIYEKCGFKDRHVVNYRKVISRKNINKGNN